MIISDAAVRRPIAMGCLIIALTLLGLNAWRKLNLELMPSLDVPFVTVVTPYPGATPDQIEVGVAKRIEDAVMGVDGLKHVTSSCMENACQTLLEFHLDVDVDVAATDVREQLDLVGGEFPPGVEDPRILKFDINAQPVATLALTGEQDVAALYDYADNDLRDRLATVPGVARLELVGGVPLEARVELDPDALAARGLTALAVSEAIGRAFVTVPAGTVREHGTEVAVTYEGEAGDLAEIGELPLAGADGARVLLRDVGRVRLAPDEPRQRAFLDGAEAVAVRVVKKPDANPVAVVAALRTRLDAIRARMPGGMRLTLVTDDATFIRATNASAWLNVAQGVALTAAILFLFLYNLRSLAVVSITMPLTIVIGLLLMHAADMTLNTSTLIAIGMSVGILVTNSIVVLEAIIARLAAGEEPRQASRLGAAEAWTAVLASAGTNVVVLLPVAVMGSMIGQFMAPLAITMLIMTAVSLGISFTLTPLLSSVLLRRHDERESGLLARLQRGWDRGLDRVTSTYAGLLRRCERHRLLALAVLILVAGVFAHSLSLLGSLGTSMVEEPDRGEIFVKLEFPTRYSLPRTVTRTRAVVDRLRDLPHLEHTLTTVGKVQGVIGQVSEGVYLAQVLLRFNERTAREATIDDLLRQTRARLADVPDAITSALQPTIVGGQGSELEMEIGGDDLATLDRLALEAARLARARGSLTDVDTTVRPGKPLLRLRPRRPVLADQRLPGAAVGATTRANLAGLEAASFTRGDRSYDLTVQLQEVLGAERVPAFGMPGEAGQPVPLASLTTVERDITPVLITRKNKRRVAKLTANLSGSEPLGTAVTGLDAAIAEADLLPPGYDTAFVGTYEIMREGQEALAEAALIALILVVLTLAAILESFTRPLLILATIPLALVGVVYALYLAGASFGIFVMLGMVMMMGIVVNNAILIVDRMGALVEEGEDRHAAMIRAARERFRPVAMITVAAVLGMLPLALGRGIGAELRNGVGLAAVGGILISGMLTLVVVPVVYDLFTHRGGEKRRERPTHRSRRPTP